MKYPAHFLMSPPDYLHIPEIVEDVPVANDFSRAGYASYMQDPAGFIARAATQWTELRDKMLQAGAIVTYVPPSPIAFDGAFVADASLTLWRNGRPHTMLSQFANAPRAPEIANHQACLQAVFGDRLVLQSSSLSCEGSGDVVYDPARHCLWAGYTTDTDCAAGRTQKATHAMLADFFGMPVHSLAVNRPFFHVDTCFAPLPGGQVLIWPEGLQADALVTIRAFIPADQIVTVSRADAYAFGCNLVAVSSDILVMPQVSDNLRRTLEHFGYTVLMCDVSQFIACGGAIHCLTNPLHLGDVP